MTLGKTFQAWVTPDRRTIRTRTIYRISTRITIPLSRWRTTTSDQPLLHITSTRP